MNNILFCTSLVTEGTLMDDYSAGALGFYDLKTLALVNSIGDKPFGLIGSTLLSNGVESIINIPDIHVLNAVSAIIPLNVSYGITIEAATNGEENSSFSPGEGIGGSNPKNIKSEPSEESESTPVSTDDVEIIVLHKNVAPNGYWRQFITIPYSDFNGDVETLLDIVTAKLQSLSKQGKLEGVTIDTRNGLQLYISNTEQYEIITKSELLDISAPSGYLPVVAPAKITELINKNTASWGIWHREEDDDWFKAISQIVGDTTELNTIVSIRYYSPRIAGVTHDETLYKTLHILTTTKLSETITAMFEVSESSEENS